jgi:WD40 repeat protein
VFDVSRPGREVARLPTAQHKRSPHGQKGIISAIAFDPAGGDSGRLYACGSYAGSICLYDAAAAGSGAGKALSRLRYDVGAAGAASTAARVAGVTAASALHNVVGQLEAATGHAPSFGSSPADADEDAQQPATKRAGGGARRQPGVTQLQWSPDGRRLYAGFRSSSEIVCFDVRKPGAPLAVVAAADQGGAAADGDAAGSGPAAPAASQPLSSQAPGAVTATLAARFPRDASSNQRLAFDLDATGSLLWTGSRDGAVLVYDTGVATGAPALVASMRGLPDAVAAVACHPAGVAFALATGERHHGRTGGAGGSGDGSESEEDAAMTDGGGQAGRAGGRWAPSALSIWRAAMPAQQASSGVDTAHTASHD